MKLFYFFTLLMVAIFSLAAGTQEAAAQAESKAVIDGRSSLMRNIRDTFEPFKAMMMAGALEVIAAQSEELHGLAQKIPTAFSKKVLSDESRAKKEIWEDWEGFTGKAKELADAIAGIQGAAKAGDAKKVEGRIKTALKACKSCHRSFRKPKAKAEDEYQ
jgi:cytochrome c556